MTLDLKSFESKLMGCWMGKNIGGTLGAPFEGQRGLLDVSFYTHVMDGRPMPNDDLDLQLVWLNAAEQHGKSLNARILAEYWLHHVLPNCSEYGQCKANLRMGLEPPFSGYVNNIHRNSCGAFIRSEIWACLSPGNPDIAAAYAYEDAIVDHSDEGVYAEVFTATLESAAFVLSDKLKLIDIALSYIPKDCGIAIGVKDALASYHSGISWQEAYKRIMKLVPGSFGFHSVDELEEGMPIPKCGWDAPSNIAITMIGWLYGEDDFGKSLCIATSCGEDTDCTAASLGSIMGIIGGIESIPDKWSKPIGNEIITICIDASDWTITIPKTIEELTKRILRLVPLFLGSDLCECVETTCGYTIKTKEGSSLYKQDNSRYVWTVKSISDILDRTPFTVKYDHSWLEVVVDYVEEPFVQEGREKKFILKIMSKKGRQDWAKIKWHIPENWTISPGKKVTAHLYQFYHAYLEMEFILTPHQLEQDIYEASIEISICGHISRLMIPVVLLNAIGEKKQNIIIQ